MGNTIYDRRYKMLQEDFPKLIIPLVNEQFHTDYDLIEQVINRSQEMHTIEGKFVMDSLYSIGSHLYHTECQSNPDGEKKMYVVPIIRVQDYSLGEIFDKKLYMLLPYYVMRYEKDKKRFKRNPQELRMIEEEYRGLLNRLESELSECDENQRLLNALESAIMSISEYTFRKDKILPTGYWQ